MPGEKLLASQVLPRTNTRELFRVILGNEGANFIAKGDFLRGKIKIHERGTPPDRFLVRLAHSMSVKTAPWQGYAHVNVNFDAGNPCFYAKFICVFRISLVR